MESRVEDLHNGLQTIHLSCHRKHQLHNHNYVPSLKRHETTDNVFSTSRANTTTGPDYTNDATIASTSSKPRRRHTGYRNLTILKSNVKQPHPDNTKNSKPKSSITHRISTGSIPTKLFQFISTSPRNTSPPNYLSAELNTSATSTPPSSPNVTAKQAGTHASSSQENPNYCSSNIKPSYAHHRSTRSEGIIIIKNQDHTPGADGSKVNTPKKRVPPISETAIFQGSSSSDCSENINKLHLLTTESSTLINEEMDIKGGTLV